MPKEDTKKHLVGDLLMVAYVAFLACIAITRWQELRALELNALGDALAGAVGPLALLMLVRGYIQQGEELRLNTEALRIQAAELKASVEQQELLVAASRAAVVAAERPILTVTASCPGGFAQYRGMFIGGLTFQIQNSGRTQAMRVRVIARFAMAAGDDGLSQAWEKLNDEFPQVAEDSPLGFVVEPGRTKTTEQAIQLSKKQVQTAHEHASRHEDEWPMLFIIGFVLYESIMRSEHKTAFAYALDAGQDYGRFKASAALHPNVKVRELDWIGGPTT